MSPSDITHERPAGWIFDTTSRGCTVPGTELAVGEGMPTRL
ncbi:hypothetical protein [Streptomyces sp. KM273126]|nr:hypothetical protein [Streptomyces sp. KM273126]